jgi:hypothetical protein
LFSHEFLIVSRREIRFLSFGGVEVVIVPPPRKAGCHLSLSAPCSLDNSIGGFIFGGEGFEGFEGILF